MARLTRRAGVLAAVAISVAGLAGGVAGADSFNPVRLSISVAPVARLAKPLSISVQVSADPGALDTATAPLRIRVKLAGECGGTFDTTPGPVLLDAELNPQPATGHAYQATARGAGKPTAYGVRTACAFLEEEGDNRQFANDTTDPPQVDVSKPCTLAARRYDRDRAALARAKRQLRHAKRRSRRAQLKKQVVRRTRTVARDRHAARSACGAGVAL